jgi:hypothetical protein
LPLSPALRAGKPPLARKILPDSAAGFLIDLEKRADYSESREFNHTAVAAPPLRMTNCRLRR